MGVLATERVARLGPGWRRVVVDGLSGPLLRCWADWFECWARPGQRAPAGEWRCWLILAGRGFGKTRAGAEWVHAEAMSGGGRIALVGASIDEARSVMVEGESGLLRVAAGHGVRLTWEPSLKRLRWPGGAVAELHSGDMADGLRGPQFHLAWCDELAKWRQGAAAWDNLRLGLRLGARPRALVTTTPRPGRLLGRIIAADHTVVTRGRTADNVALAADWVAAMEADYGGSRIGRQELDGEYLGEAEGSLFPRALIEAARGDLPERFVRMVVAVDPPAGESEDADACGIVVCGEDEAGVRWVVADASVSGKSPEGWARAVAACARGWGLDGPAAVVAEANNGGAMVRAVLEAADAGLSVRLVHAAIGKAARAEPVAALFEARRARLGGVFVELEGSWRGCRAGDAMTGRGGRRIGRMRWCGG